MTIKNPRVRNFLPVHTALNAPTDQEQHSVKILHEPTGPTEPQKGIQQPHVGVLERLLMLGSTARLWIVGTHGGAGESALTQIIDGSRATSHAWPVIDQDETEGAPVLLVCRSDLSGLKAAQRVITGWASGSAPHIHLLGLAILADAPGKLPRPLRDFAPIVGGGAPRWWHLPWVDAWRLGEPEPTQLPRQTRKFVADINSLLPSQRQQQRHL